MQGVFLAGGRGSRLGRLTRNTPKPLLDVQGRPFIEWVIAKAKARGITEILILAGYKPRKIAQLGYPCIVECEPMGTGGSLRSAARYLREEFFLFNGDTICDFDYMQLCHKIGDAGCVAAMIKNDGQYIGAGVYFMRRRFVGHIPRCPSSLENDIMPRAIKVQDDVVFHKVEGRFIDMGTPKNYQKAQRERWICQQI